MTSRVDGRYYLCLITGLILAGSTLSIAQAQGTKEDYARASNLRARTKDKVVRDQVEPHWFSRNDRFWYRVKLGEGRHEYLLVDAVQGKKTPAFDHAKMAEVLAKASGKPVAPDRLPIDFLEYSDDGKIHLAVDAKGWVFDPVPGTLESGPTPVDRSISAPEPTPRGRNRRGTRPSATSPDGRWTAIVRDHKLFVKAKGSETEIALDTGSAADGYEQRFYWSPDSNKLAAIKVIAGDEHKVFVVQSSPRDQIQPKLQSYDYLKPGDRVPIARPRLFDVTAPKPITIAEDLFTNPWSIDEYAWSPDSKRFSFLFNQRGHQALRLVSVDAETGEAKAIINELSPTFIDYSSKMFFQRLDKTNEILWMSERDGWNHLYLIDSTTGAVKSQATKGEWVVLGVDQIDEEKRQIWFRAGGVRGGQDPYYVHHARVNFDGTGLIVLTEGDGTHRIRYSPDRRFLLDSYSRVDMPPVTELRKVEDGTLVCELERGDASSLIAEGWKAPERFVAKGRDGKTDIFGVIYRPTNFDPAKKYPVIEAIYAGPQGAFVPKAFAAVQGDQALAELGFIVVKIDGMGTNWRSKAYHNVCWKNLGDAGFPDRILWMKAAAERYPFMDLTRVGIYGGSAGGQNAMGGLLFHPEFYKVGAADCGCHDNRMDKIWWNEAWMGWPVGKEYAESSNVDNAAKLQGKLLLTVGETDHNVDPASTMQVANALIRANKDFELVIFPGADHGAGSSQYGERRRRDFFVRHLLGVEPRP